MGCTVALVVHPQQFVPAGVENHDIAFVDFHVALALECCFNFRLIERCAFRNDVFAHQSSHVQQHGTGSNSRYCFDTEFFQACNTRDIFAWGAVVVGVIDTDVTQTI